MAKPRRKKFRITGVTAKIVRLKSSIKALVKYILDLEQKQEKLFCPAWLQGFRRPIPAPGKDLTGRQLGRSLTDQIEQAVEWFQTNRSPVVEITLSLAPGQSWSPRQWKLFWRKFLKHLSSVTYVTDHCVRRQGLHGPRVRPPRHSQADLNMYVAVVPIHQNSPSHHLQALLGLRDPVHRQVAVVNEGYFQIAVQWAARRAEVDLGLTPHPNLPDYEAWYQDGRLQVVDPDLIERTGNTFKFVKKRKPDPQKLKDAQTKSSIMRGVPSAVLRLRKIFGTRTPDSFTNLHVLHRFLRDEQACLLRPKRTAGLKFCIQGSHANPSDVSAAWLSELLLKRWPKLKQRGYLVGMDPELQKRLTAEEKKARFLAAGISPGNPTPSELKSIVKTAHGTIDQLPWSEVLIEQRGLNGSSIRCGEMSLTKLKEKISSMFDPKNPALDQTLHFRPVLPETILALPLWQMSRANADRLGRNYAIAQLTETQPDLYDALLLLEAIPGAEPWESKRALRRLTLWLAKRYQARPGVVAADGVALPGLPQLAGAGHPVLLVGQARNQICPHASRLLEKFGTKLAGLEKLWWQGAPGQVLKQKRAKALHYAPKIYLESVKILAQTEQRIPTVHDMNVRIVARMMGRRMHIEEVWPVLDRVRKVWPELLPEDNFALWEEAGRFAKANRINLSRSPALFRVPVDPTPPIVHQAPAVSPPGPVSMAQHNVPIAQNRNPDPIEPDFIKYAVGWEPPDPIELRIKDALSRLFDRAGGFTKTLKEKWLNRKAAPEPTLAMLKNHAQQCFSVILEFDAQMQQHRREAIPARIEVPAVREQSNHPPPEISPSISAKPVTSGIAKAAIAIPADSAPKLVPMPGAQPDPGRIRQLGKPLQAAGQEEADGRDSKPPETRTPTPPAPVIPVSEPKETEGRRRRREEQLRKLESLAGLLQALGQSTDAEKLMENPEVSTKAVFVFARLSRALMDASDGTRMTQLRSWLKDRNAESPDWLDSEVEKHHEELDQELEVARLIVKPARPESARTR